MVTFPHVGGEITWTNEGPISAKYAVFFLFVARYPMITVFIIDWMELSMCEAVIIV